MIHARAKAFELVDSGLVDVDTMLSACLAYLSEDDVNDLSPNMKSTLAPSRNADADADAT